MACRTLPDLRTWHAVPRQDVYKRQGLLDGDGEPVHGHGVLGAGVATGSTEGYIYVRAEYPMAVHLSLIHISCRPSMTPPA